MKRALGKVADATGVRLQAVHVDIPEDRMSGIVARSLLGGFISLVGFVLLGGAAAVAGYLMVREKTPTAIGFGALGVMGMAGLFLFGWGLVIAAGRLVRHPLSFVAATFGGVIDVWRRPGRRVGEDDYPRDGERDGDR